MSEIKITQEFETTTKVAKSNSGWLWLQISIGEVETDEGKYQIQFNKDLSVKTPDGKVVVSVPLIDLISQMIDHAKAVKRNPDTAR